MRGMQTLRDSVELCNIFPRILDTELPPLTRKSDVLVTHEGRQLDGQSGVRLSRQTRYCEARVIV